MDIPGSAETVTKAKSPGSKSGGYPDLLRKDDIKKRARLKKSCP